MLKKNLRTRLPRFALIKIKTIFNVVANVKL